MTTTWLNSYLVLLLVFPICSTYSHCAFSSNLFHRHIVQKYIDQMSPPENKKCSPGKVFWIKSAVCGVPDIWREGYDKWTSAVIPTTNIVIEFISSLGALFQKRDCLDSFILFWIWYPTLQLNIVLLKKSI